MSRWRPHPGTPEYDRLTPFDKFEAANEWFQRAQAGDRSITTDRIKLGMLRAKYDAEQRYWRTVCIGLSPAFDHRNHYLIARPDGARLLEDNWAQRTLEAIYMYHRNRDIPMRLKVPKSRKQGISTKTAALFTWEVARHPHTDGVVLAQQDEDCTPIFKIYRRFQDNFPESVRPPEDRSSRKELLYAHDSSIVIRPAGGPMGAKARGGTPKVAHTTESSSWPSQQVQQETYVALRESFPKSGFTCWVDESTGRGRVGPFFEGCEAVMADPIECLDIDPAWDWVYRSNETDWWLFFVPWVRRYDTLPPYHDPSPKELEAIQRDITEAEAALMAPPYRATLGQIHWWRQIWKSLREIPNEADRLRFAYQEHPLLYEHCFQEMSGDIFDHAKLDEAAKAAEAADAEKKPWQGDIGTADGVVMVLGPDGRIPHKTPKPRLDARIGGPLTIWEMPHPGRRRYVIGVDLSMGTLKGDFTVFAVFDRKTRKFVARWRARKDSLDSMMPLRLLSKLYNDADMNIEINTSIELPRLLAMTDRRGLLCRMKNIGGGGDSFQYAFGWHTGATTKPLLMGALKRALRHEPSVFRDGLMLKEMRYFREVETPAGGIKIEGAAGSNHDDVAMAGALALVADQATYVSFADAPADEDPFGPKTLKERIAQRPRKGEPKPGLEL